LYASWILLGKRARATLPPFAILTYVFGFAALILLPFQFFTPQPWPLPSSGWLWFAGLVVLSTITGFALYTMALGILPASVASILAMTEIVFVGVYAYLLLDESLTGVLVLGAALVVGGVLLLTARGLRNAKD
jgi:drug/metabolite transporter (DMT)-like permease